MMRTPSPVLVIEDDALLGQTLLSTLESQGCSVLWRRSADDGLAAARAFHPTVILLDARLAGRGGRGLLRALKADPLTRPIPVLVVAAEAEGLAAEDRALAHAVLPARLSLDGLVGVLRSVPAELDTGSDDTPISAADRHLMALCDEALLQTGGDRAAADQLVAMRLMREHPEDAAARGAVLAEWDRLIRAAQAALGPRAGRAALEAWARRRLRS
jgi:CheY-like chemotaxis protein